MCLQHAEKGKLFPGAEKAEGRFSKALKKLLQETPELGAFFSNISDLGTHSNRKGCVSFVLMFVVIFQYIFELAEALAIRKTDTSSEDPVEIKLLDALPPRSLPILVVKICN